MKKISTLLILFTVGFLNVISAQITETTASLNTGKIVRCYTVEAMAEARKNKPNAETDQQFEGWLRGLIQASTARTNVNYTLPIVFHVVHNGEAVGTGFNISSAFIQSQLHQLNKDFANLSNSPYAVAANTGLQFRMAQTDPQGVALGEAGIERISRTSKGFTTPGTSGWTMSYITNTIKPATYWDPYKYINIWILPISGGILGYATFPGSSTLSGLDNGETDQTAGVVVTSTSVGSIANPNGTCASNAYGQGKTLTHELGHFFGLRHIWGDANCGDDFCNDTPTHQTNNGGVPSHPKPNTCGTADEMFENYMDYTDDNVTNTFTNDQTSRIQTVMLNSPRRKELATSNVPVGTLTSNKISFLACANSITVSEKATTTSTFPTYRDIPVIINVEDRATGSATLTITAAGTASAGTDYQLMTPSVTYVNGDANKVVTLRILDDGIAEGNKTITLSYTISGSGVTAAAGNQTFSVTLLDDDAIRPAQNRITLLNEQFEAIGANGMPAGWNSLIGANSANSYVVSANGSANGTGMAAHITNNTTTKPNTYTKTTTSLAVIRTPLIDATGLSNLTVQYKIRVAGESTTSSVFDYAYTAYSTEATPTSFSILPGTGAYASTDATPIAGVITQTIVPTFNNTKFHLGNLWRNDDADGNDPGVNIDDFVVTADGTKIETALNASNSFAVPAGATVNYKSTQNERLIASVRNANTSIPQLTATIVEAGNDRPLFITGNGSFMRTRKVFRITPPTANNSTTYQATLYFTADEMAAWGANAANLKILKVTDNTDLSANISLANGEIVTPSSVDNKLSTDGYIAYTGNFTGFSKFVLVDQLATLPLTWLDFTGTLKGDKVALKWATATEHNNKGFEVERSKDGTTFTKIGWVDGLNGTNTNHYNIDDINLVKGNRYYYRLKQIDFDGRFSYSPIVSIAYLGADRSITFYPNPVKDVLTIQNNGSAVKGSVVITDMGGRIVYRSQSLASGKMEISAATWSTGVYTIKVETEGKPMTFKVIKQ